MPIPASPSSPRITLGIDTGGTYTDAVVIDRRDHAVLATTKALTTKGDLAIGITEALNRALDEAGKALPTFSPARDVERVALSTTLATNALVEGHGEPVGVILIGFDDRMVERVGLAAALPSATLIRLAGGHDHGGHEVAPLDEAALSSGIDAIKDHVAAYAVASTYSVRNPDHERRAAAVIRARTGKPVGLSSDLASALDAPRRALTAALNASIVGPIVRLVDAINGAMRAHGITAPLMIVKGDGALADASVIMEKPIETILSGPAASVIGARFLADLDDFVISDIGGTTTDVAVVAGGWPKLNREGAVVGRHRTLVRAVDMRTVGLGGDSAVEIGADGKVTLSTSRIVPIALLGARWPDLVVQLERMVDDPEAAAHGGRYLLRPLGASGADPSDVTDPLEVDILKRVGDRPVAMAVMPSNPSQRRAMRRLIAKGRLAEAGFTPSDAAHVLGLQGQWSRAAAEAGAALVLRSQRMIDLTKRAAATEAFAREVIDAVAKSSCHVILETLAGVPLDRADPIVAAAIGARPRLGALEVLLQSTIPLVAVGGPAAVFYPEVARRMGTPLIVPAHASVANAVGAAVGVVRARATVEITTSGGGVWRIHHAGAPIDHISPTAALEAARQTASAEARARATADGITLDETLDLDIRVDRVDLPDMTGDLGLVAATVVAECRASIN